MLSIEMRGTGRPDHLTVHWNFPSEDGNGTPGRGQMQSFRPEVNGYGWSIREESRGGGPASVVAEGIRETEPGGYMYRTVEEREGL